MTRTSSARTRLFARFAAPLLLASTLGACSSIPDWVDPTGWFGGDSQTGSDESGAAADATQTPDGKTPDLASIPPKPAPPSTPDEQQQVANSLAADRAQAQYSAENLQGGTEPVAPPPPPQSSAPETTATQTAPVASTEQSEAPAASAANTAPPPAAAPESTSTEVASTESPATTAPAAAPMAAATASSPLTSDVSFAASHAPALDASVTQYVPQSILSRYQQTAVAASVPGVEGMPASAARPASRRKARTPPADTSAPAQ